jgi:heme/copper-type cytochrome/quinol oxidase subunit 3
MSAHTSETLPLIAGERPAPVVPSGVLGMLIFVVAEAMLFAGLVSAFTIIRASAVVWPPRDQPRLPVEETALNTAALLLSGVLLFLAQRALRRDRAAAARLLLISLLLGVFFVTFQGVEWVRLIGQGLTLTSSSLGSFFYLIIGLHALHAVAAVALLARVSLGLRRSGLAAGQLATAAVFWYFVVIVWPVLYFRVYL